MANYNLLPTYLEEMLFSMKVHLEQIKLFEIVGINHEQGKMQENLALPIPKSRIHERNAFRKKLQPKENIRDFVRSELIKKQKRAYTCHVEIFILSSRCC
jgi:hypothetical protein